MRIYQIPLGTLLFIGQLLSVLGVEMSSGVYSVTQTWAQETAFARPYHVSVPSQDQPEPFPVFIFLHGNGGSAERAKTQIMNRYPRIAQQYIMVFADGYKKSWNSVSERSRADDRGFIESIIQRLVTYDNVQRDTISIMGVSNGAALVNQLAIESQLPHIKNYISSVSPLNRFQHDGTNFRAKGDNNNYREIAKPQLGKRLMNISGTEDRLIPYAGGPSPRIPAKGGKLGFLAAEESIFIWAKHMGYKGNKLATPSRTQGNLETFSYLNGDIIHYKVIDGGHSATWAISELILLKFLEETQ